MPNLTPLYITSDFFHLLLISRVWAIIKAAKKIRKNELPAKLHTPKVAKFARLPPDMPIFGDL